jgi:hypothetical protein
MTPDKLIDYTIKFGVIPLALTVIFWTRSDLQDTKDDVKQIQALLNDCYKDQIRTLQPTKGLSTNVIETTQVVAVLPEKIKVCYEI